MKLNKKKKKKYCIIGAHTGVYPGPLEPKSDELTTWLRGQIVRLPN